MDKKSKTIIIVCVILLIGIACYFCVSFARNNSKPKEQNNENIEVTPEITPEVTEVVVTETVTPEVTEKVTKTPEVTEVQKNSEEAPASNDEKAIQIVKKKWGNDDSVYFNIQTIDAAGNYVVSVNDKESTSVLEWYTVNVKTGECKN